MRMTLQQYNELALLPDNVREKQHKEILASILENPEKYEDIIHEFVDYMVTELGNADFIRLYDNVRDR
jgi:hypothetical protein